MKLTAMLRVKNEMPVIIECLTKLSSLVDEIVVIDNGSTDGTLKAYERFNKVVQIIKTDGYHEGRDKTLLHGEVKKRNPDWIIWVDGDEVFEDHFTRKEVEKYMSSGYNRILFRMYNFWLNKSQYRIDRNYFFYTLHPQRSMWRNLENGYFSSKKMHNGDIRGIPKPFYISPYRIKHYGYADKDKVQRKFLLYRQVDDTTDEKIKRNYQFINPEVETIRLRFFEPKGAALNKIFIVIFKYLQNIIYFAMIFKSYIFTAKLL